MPFRESTKLARDEMQISNNHDFSLCGADILSMAKQKFRPTRLGIFSGAKAYIVYVEVLKICRNAVGRTFCDAIKGDNRK
jgi:hypothetical protein